MTKRKICVVTGSRAEYGLLYWLMKDIEADPDLVLQLVVTGTHLAPRFGDTHKMIQADGFAIAAGVDIEIGDDTPAGVSRSLGLAVIGISKAFEQLKPDIVVVLGDRFEILGAAQAALMAHLPIAHICGGECTAGSTDDSIRHAITKMAHLHFAAIEEYRQRIIQLGEPSERSFTVGAPGLDNLVRLDLPDRNTLETELAIDLGEKYFLITYHPLTIAGYDQQSAVDELLAALDSFPGHNILMTGVNADAGSTVVGQALVAYARKWPGRAFHCLSLGQRRYLSAMKHCQAVVGNSSSGLVEAPVLGVPTVNVGDRQNGRLCPPSVVTCGKTCGEIVAAIEQVIDAGFRPTLAESASLYGSPGAAGRIKTVLKDFPQNLILEKKFCDIGAA